MKRIYKIVSTKNTPKGYEILLDDRPLKTPGKKSFLLPCEALAQEVMREWAGQGKKIIPDTMPITQIICTKIDRVCSERAAMTMGELCDLYLKKIPTLVQRRRGRPKKASTLATDRGRIERHIKPLLGPRRVRDITARDIARFQELVASGATKASPYSSKSIRSG